MTGRQRTAGWLGVVLVPAVLLGFAPRAGAQDTKTQDTKAKVKVTIADDIVREVLGSVDQLINTEISGQIADAIRTATGTSLTRGELRALVAAQNRDFRVSQEARETKTLQLGAAGALELRTIGGDVTVAAVSGTQTSIEIVRVSRGRTDADAKLGLERVNAQIDQRGDRATVDARYPSDSRPPYSVTVSYHVKAPAGTRLTINTLGGNVMVSDIKGEMTTSTAGGDTTITNAHGVSAKSLGGTMKITGIDSDGTVQVSTLGGDVDIQKVKAKRLDATTVGGNISATDVTCDSANVGTMGGNVTFAGPVAKSGRYELHTSAGNVHFIPSGNVGFEMQASTFAGEIRTEGVTLQLSGSVAGRGPNRSLRGTVGDGSALVILRTFSGEVIVGKK